VATTDDIIALVKTQLSTSADIISAEGYLSVVDTAASELSWPVPTTDPNRIVWLTKRALRHALFILWVAAAQKFKYKQVNLQQRFEHYGVLIKALDKEYEDALQNQVNIFANVASYKQFGTVVGAGFSYDAVGRDTTYDVSALLNAGS
jgi:hypothetical protein